MTPELSAALVRYRVMAYVVGVGLLVLVLVGVPLRYGAGIGIVVAVVGPLHGALYLVYLVTVADLARRDHWRVRRLVWPIAAGFVPGVAFVVEHAVSSRMESEAATTGQDPSAPRAAR